MLPICVEAIIRAFFHFLKFLLHKWFLVLLLIIILAILRKPLIIGIAGYIAKLPTLIPAISTAWYYNPFVQIIVWITMLLFSPVNIFIKIASLPFFFFAGLVIGVLSIIPYVGKVITLIPFAPVVGYLLSVPTINNFLALVPAFYGLKIWLFGGKYFCTAINKFLKFFE